MKNENFIREVDEEIREERLLGFWQSYGVPLLSALMAFLIAVAAYEAYFSWQSHKSQKIGDAFLSALQQADSKDTDKALKALKAVSESGFGGYPTLANFRIASLEAAKGNYQASVARLDKMAQDSSVGEALRIYARLKAANLLAEHGNFADVEKRIKDLTVAKDPKNQHDSVVSLANETLGLAALKAGDRAKALLYLKAAESAAHAEIGVGARVQILLDVLQNLPEKANIASASGVNAPIPAQLPAAPSGASTNRQGQAADLAVSPSSIPEQKGHSSPRGAPVPKGSVVNHAQ